MAICWIAQGRLQTLSRSQDSLKHLAMRDFVSKVAYVVQSCGWYELTSIVFAVSHTWHHHDFAYSSTASTREVISQCQNSTGSSMRLY